MHATRDICATAAMILLVMVGAACTRAPETPAGDVMGQGLPEGYEVSLDRSDRSATEFRVQATSTGLHVRTGPAGILFRPQDRIEAGHYSVSAEFIQVAAPRGHREGYGLFVGGRELKGAAQVYTYFLIRADGRFLIKARSASRTRDLTDEWISSDAVAVAADADTTNTLSIRVTGGRVQFHCNGVRVAELGGDGLSTHGVAGIRVNHHLDIVVRDFRIDR
jgi:hypothetical protein